MLSAALPPNENKRIAALQSYDILDTDAERDFDDLTELASLICGVPIALISLIDLNRQWYKSHKGLEVSQTDRTESFCTYAIQKPGEVMVVTDAHKDERFKNNPLVTGWLNLTFYAGVPLVNEDGYALGSLCVLDNKKRHLTIAQTEALQALARQVMDKMELRRKQKLLAEANRQLDAARSSNEQLHRQVTVSESKFRNLVKQAPVAMCTLMGTDYRIDLFNDKMLELWGRKAEDVAGVPLFTAIPEASDSSYANLLKQVYTTGKGKLLRETPLTLIKPGRKATTLWLNVLYEPLRNESGDITGIIMLDMDVTEQVAAKRKAQALQDELYLSHRETREKERTLRIAIEAASLYTWTLQFATGEIIADEALKMQYGFDPDETVVLEQVLDIIDPDYVALVTNAIEAALRMESPPAEYPIRNRKTGERRWMRSVGKVECDRDGKAVCLIGMNADITEQKEYQLEIEKLNAELSAANNELRKAYDDLRHVNYTLQQRSEELAQSHMQLQESEENLRLATDAANLGMWVMNLENDDYQVSEKFKTLYGMPAGLPVTTEQVLTRVDSRYALALQHKIADSIAQKGSIDTEFLIHKLNTGEPRWIRKHGKVLTNAAGKATLFIGMNADVTEKREYEMRIQKLNEQLILMNIQMQSVVDDLQSANDELTVSDEKLTASHDRLAFNEEQLRIAVEAANLGVWNLNLQTEELIVSDNLKKMYGYLPSHIMTVENVLGAVNAHDRNRVDNIIKDAVEKGVDIYIDWSITNKTTGEIRCLRAVGQMDRNKKGKPLRLIGVTADITEQKAATESIEKLNRELQDAIAKLAQSEELLQLALQSADIAVWHADVVTNELTLSEEQRKLHGIPPDKHMVFSDAYLLIDEAHRQYVYDEVSKTVETGLSFNVEYKIHPMDGSLPRWICSTGILSVTDGGAKKTIIGTSVNIDERKQNELRKSDFISMVSHEMKAPLTTIISALKIIDLSAPEDEPVIKEMSALATGQARKLISLVNGFLNMSREETSKIHLDKIRFSLRQLIELLTAEFSLRHPGYHFYFDDCEDLEVVADKDKINTVISNFLSNAVKYSPQSTVVSITCTHEAEGCKVSVTDSGMGISVADQAHIFDRFFRVQSANVKSVTGYGIGLYLCSEIIEAHQGEIGVESEEGKGSTFWFMLPS